MPSQRQRRIDKAVLLWSKGHTYSEIADEIGVTSGTISNYLNSDRAKEGLRVHKQVHKTGAIRELQEQKRELYEQLEEIQVDASEASEAVKIVQDDDGEHFVLRRDEEIVDTLDDFDSDEWERVTDDETRYFRRREAREILGEIRDIQDQLTQITGIDEPQEVEVEHSGQVDHRVELTSSEKEDLNDLLSPD